MQYPAPDDSVVHLDQPIPPGRFAALVGVTPQAISRRLAEGTLAPGATARLWLLAYIGTLRDAASRHTSPEGRELVREKTELARAQREAQELKNAVARGEFAPIALIADVLADATSVVASRLEGLESKLAKVAPDLPDQARQAVLATVRDARNEWVEQVREHIVDRVDQVADLQGRLADAQAELAALRGDKPVERAPAAPSGVAG